MSEKTPRETEAQVSLFTKDGISKRLRLLKWNELVKLGDFVMNDRRSFELWDGPTGFLANAFVKSIYRQDKGRSFNAKEQA